MIPQYPYGLSSLYLCHFSNLTHIHTHTHTHTHTPIPGMPHQPYPQPIECGNCSTSQCNTSPLHTATYPPHAAIHSLRLDYTCTTYPTFYTTIHTYNDTYTLPSATTPFHFPTVSTEHISKNITLLYQSTF